MTTTPLTSQASLDYGIDTLFGRVNHRIECQAGLEQVADKPDRFALRVPAPVPEDLEKATFLVVVIDGRRLNGAVREAEWLDDDSLKLEVEPD